MIILSEVSGDKVQEAYAFIAQSVSLILHESTFTNISPAITNQATRHVALDLSHLAMRLIAANRSFYLGFPEWVGCLVLPYTWADYTTRAHIQQGWSP